MLVTEKVPVETCGVASLSDTDPRQGTTGDGCNRRPGLSDRILIGMAAKGHCLEALALYLCVSTAELLRSIVRLDLPTPSTRPMRKPGGRRPWTIGEVHILIDRYSRNFHVTCIGAEVARSPGAVRSKARRLGLYRRDRRTTVRCLHGDCSSGHASAAAVSPVSCAAIASGSAGRTPSIDLLLTATPMAGPEPADKTSAALAGEAAIAVHGADAVLVGASPVVSEHVVETPPTLASETDVAAEDLTPVEDSEVTRSVGRVDDPLPGGGEMPIEVAEASNCAGVIETGDPCKVASRPTAEAARAVDAKRAKRIKWNDTLDLELARRWFAWQCRKGIAADMGIPEAAIRSRATRMGLPARPDRKKIVPDYVLGRPYDAALEQSQVRRRCQQGNMFFFGPRNGPHTSPKIMKTKKYREARRGLGEATSLHL